MAGYVLHLSTEENITLSSATVKRLIAGGSGDAALLYLAILHVRGAADSGKLARELKWDETRLRAAEQALYEMELVGHDFYLFVDKESERSSAVALGGSR